MATVWYRVDSFRSHDHHRHLTVLEYRVISTTMTGVWLDMGGGVRRFTKRNVRRRFATPTKHEALVSFLHRKRRQVKILTKQLEEAKALTKLVEMELQLEKGTHTTE